ncbi:MAG: helix-hairpin-helix domain-containing protein [Firmicutes bacterium]|nr:helix-hairpin-helix domain-containing protein [Bacillota bacterium]
MLITNREKLLFFIISVLIIALSGTIYINHNKTSQFVLGEENIAKTKEIDTIEIDEQISTEPKMIGIHIGGQVKNPGFIWIEEGTRLYDALNYIGGSLPEADLDMVNLSKILSDEEKIYIPKKGEDASIDMTQYSETSNSSTNKMININTASEAELSTLPGIGPALSKKIVDHRDSKGFFKSTEDIRDVSGIGEKRYDGIKDLITVK